LFPKNQRPSFREGSDSNREDSDCARVARYAFVKGRKMMQGWGDLRVAESISLEAAKDNKEMPTQDA